MLDGEEVRREASVHAENFVLDEGRHRHAVEAVDEGLPESDVEPALTWLGVWVHYS